MCHDKTTSKLWLTSSEICIYVLPPLCEYKSWKHSTAHVNEHEYDDSCVRPPLLWQKDIFTAGKGHLAMELGQFSVFIAQIRLFTFQSSVFTAA